MNGCVSFRAAWLFIDADVGGERGDTHLATGKVHYEGRLRDVGLECILVPAQ